MQFSVVLSTNTHQVGFVKCFFKLGISLIVTETVLVMDIFSPLDNSQGKTNFTQGMFHYVVVP